MRLTAASANDAPGGTSGRRLPPARYQTRIIRDARVPVGRKGGTLSADLYLPACEDPVPALVTVLPYRKDLPNLDLTGSLRWLSAQGYACVLADQSGIGSSDGLPHPPWSPGETDDALAVLEWTAAQPWCDGRTGMWGHSHGGFTSMRVASRRPACLRAIVPVMNALDVERDAMHPAGARGDLLRLASWGGMMLLQQLLPPLLNYASPDEQRRWRHRLRDAQPAVTDLAQLGPGHPAWRERVVDPGMIEVPVLCVGGWQDLYPDAVLRAYERIAAPKKLLIGPWPHTLPQVSDGAVDFLPMMLRWWDHWLRGVDNGIMDEPPVTLYTLGAQPGWHTCQQWPPKSTEVTWSAKRDGTLVQGAQREEPGSMLIAEFIPEPGDAMSCGSEGVGLGILAAPPEPGDDRRALMVTTSPLDADLHLIGHAEVAVTLADEAPAAVDSPQRLVARLADVAPDGAATFITCGIQCLDWLEKRVRITMSAAAYTVPAGHRIRLDLSDSDFPRLAPLRRPVPILIAGLELSVGAGDDGSVARIAEVTGPADCSPAPAATPGYWRVIRDESRSRTEVRIKTSSGAAHTSDGHLLERQAEINAAVGREAEATITARHRARLLLSSGENIAANATIHSSSNRFWAYGEVRINGETTFSRIWVVQPSGGD